MGWPCDFMYEVYARRKIHQKHDGQVIAWLAFKLSLLTMEKKKPVLALCVLTQEAVPPSALYQHKLSHICMRQLRKPWTWLLDPSFAFPSLCNTELYSPSPFLKPPLEAMKHLNETIQLCNWQKTIQCLLLCFSSERSQTILQIQ